MVALAVEEPSKSSSRKPILPVIPRALERKNKLDSGERSYISSDSGIGKYSKNELIGQKTESPSGDWASIVGEDEAQQELEETCSVKNSQGGNIAQTTLMLGVNLRIEHDEDFPERSEDLEGIPSLTSSPPKSILSDHITNFPPEVSPLSQYHSELATLRFDSGIVFGGDIESSTSSRIDPGIVFGTTFESSESSPTLPASTPSSNYTQPSPLSDTNTSNSTKMAANGAPVNGTAQNGQSQNGLAQPGPQLPWPLGQQNIGPANMMQLQFGPQNAFPLNMVPLHTHLLSVFDNPVYTDVELRIQTKFEPGPRTVFAHSVVLVRSGWLQTLVSATTPINGIRRIDINTTNDDYITIRSFVAVLRLLYGEQPQAYFPDGTPADVRMDESLAWIATGRLFMNIAVGNIGAIKAMEAMRPSNLVRALVFALNGHNGYDDGTDTEHERLLLDTPGASTYHPSSDELFQHVARILIANMPLTFELNPRAPAIAAMPHSLPPVDRADGNVQGIQPTTNPAVASLQLGAVPQNIDAATTRISSILLSIPAGFLRKFFEAGVGTAELQEAVLEERERRRAHWLRGEGVGPSPELVLTNGVHHAEE